MVAPTTARVCPVELEQEEEEEGGEEEARLLTTKEEEEEDSEKCKAWVRVCYIRLGVILTLIWWLLVKVLMGPRRARRKLYF